MKFDFQMHPLLECLIINDGPWNSKNNKHFILYTHTQMQYVIIIQMNYLSMAAFSYVKWSNEMKARPTLEKVK